MMKLSSKGLAVLHTFEGCRLKAYKCSAGKWTIGWGHTGADVVPGLVITQEQANQLAMDDLAKFEKAVSKTAACVHQSIFDACVLFAFNCGIAAFQNSTLLKLIRAGDYEKAALEFEKWDKADGSHNGKDDDGDGLIDEAGEKQRLAGLSRRRRAEKALFLGEEVDFK